MMSLPVSEHLRTALSPLSLPLFIISVFVLSEPPVLSYGHLSVQRI